MTIVINKKNAEQLKRLLTEKKEHKPQKGNLSMFFGTLKRGIDGLAYQKKMREGED